MNEDCQRAEAALAALETDEVSSLQAWPPVAERIRLARKGAGATEAEVAARAGLGAQSTYRDLELYDDEAFTCVSVADLHGIAAALGTTGSRLLFGEDLRPPSEGHDFDTIADLLRRQVDGEGVTAHVLGERIGWGLQGILRDPRAVGDLNIAGLRDVCRAVGAEWIGAFLAAGAGRPRG